MTRITFFGGAVLDTEAGPVTGRAVQRHRVALLALLSTTRRCSRTRDQLVAFLWPDADAERGRKLLSDSIYRINRALGDDAVTCAGEDVRLNRNRIGGDVAAFEAAIDARDWRRAVELYAGPFLDGFYLPNATEFDQWMEVERAQYARNAAKALEALARDAHNAGRTAESIDWWQRLASLVPDDSRVAMELMQAFADAGHRAGALQHARAHASFLRDIIGVEPDCCVQRLADEIASRRDTAVDEPTGNSIAILPFDNLSDSNINAHFADGVSEELMYLLTRTPGFRVASRTSAFAYRDLKLDVREIARRLDVDLILEGSVRHADGELRIATQLTDARNGFQIWSECFDEPSTDDFAMQERIARAIADRLTPAVER